MSALPAKPNLRRLRNEAKDLHKALAVGDPEAVARVARWLPRLDRGGSAASVTLQEVQHALAREYGHRTWAELAAVAQPAFGALAALSDHDMQVLLRETGHSDLVVSLKAADEAVKDRILGNMSERVRTFVSEEMEFLGPMPLIEVEEAQRRVAQQARQLGAAGRIAWPPVSAAAPRQPEGTPETPDAVEALRQPLEALTIEEVCQACRGLRRMAEAAGILSLESVLEGVTSPFVREAIRLVVDGTEPDLVRNMLRTRAQTLVHALETRLALIREGMVSIRAGDNPRITVHKLRVIYSTDFGEPDAPAASAWSEDWLQQRLDSLRRRFADRPASVMGFDELTAVLAEIAELARREGSAYLERLLDAIDDDLLRKGLHMVASQAELPEMTATLEGQISATVHAAQTRYRLVTEGVVVIQHGTDATAAPTGEEKSRGRRRHGPMV